MTPKLLITLVAHGDASIRAPVVRQIGDQTGWSVQGASNGGELVTLALATLPELIILDPYLQGMDGVATIAALRAHGITCPIIALVEHDSESRSEWAARGYLGALTLSEGLARLLPQLHALLDSR
jgi:two-component system OmpR family response regulator